MISMCSELPYARIVLTCEVRELLLLKYERVRTKSFTKRTALIIWVAHSVTQNHQHSVQSGK